VHASRDDTSIRREVSRQLTDEKLHRIVRELEDVQSRATFALGAMVKHTGNYYHEYSTTIEVFNNDDDTVWTTDEQDKDISEVLRRFMKWIYRQLQSEYEYRTSDEVVIEDIRGDKMEFTEEGKRDHG
jgi:hypothetical protein